MTNCNNWASTIELKSARMQASTDTASKLLHFDWNGVAGMNMIAYCSEHKLARVLHQLKYKAKALKIGVSRGSCLSLFKSFILLQLLPWYLLIRHPNLLWPRSEHAAIWRRLLIEYILEIGSVFSDRVRSWPPPVTGSSCSRYPPTLVGVHDKVSVNGLEHFFLSSGVSQVSS